MAVALYARVSTTRQAEKDLSIPDQLKQMRDWCQRNGQSVAHEYVEPGASATDDRRPVFQQMIADATAKAAPYDAVIVHSLSRFFRDAIELGIYERTLKKAGVRLISITQPTSDDAMGEMIRRIFSTFDEYQSKENGKHTLRAMQENARQGYFNGSRPPFGYRAVEVENTTGKSGRKKRLEVDESEAAVVRRMFDLYENGLNGVEMGSKQIAAHFNERGVLLRGAKWARNRVHAMLCDTAYKGEYRFNKVSNRTREAKPPEEWILVSVPPIVSAETFDAVAARRHARSPAVSPARTVNSPTLLTGLLKCGVCGAGMTLMTGKGGKYRYYKCNTRIGQHAKACTTPAIPVDKLDTLVLTALADKVLSAERLKVMLAELKARFKAMKGRQDDVLRAMQKDLTEIETAITRLYEAVEKGLLPMDDMLGQRVQTLKAKREGVLGEMARTRQTEEAPLLDLSNAQVVAFATAIRARLLDRSTGFPKQYLQALVSEIVFDGEKIHMQGRKAAALAAAADEKMGTFAKVPTFDHVWLPDLGSNQGPTD